MKIEIDKQRLREAHKHADAAGKKLLEDLHGAEMFAPATADLIQFVKDACIKQGLNFESAVPFKDPANSHERGLNAMAMMMIGAKEFQGDWVPDWSDTKQKKWWPYYNMSSGVGFSYSRYDDWHTNTNVGSRLCFPTHAKAEEFARLFLPVITEFLTL